MAGSRAFVTFAVAAAKSARAMGQRHPAGFFVAAPRPPP